MNVLVVGGTGFVGSRTVEALVTAGHAVTCLLRPTSDTRRIDHLSWRRMTGDIRDVASLEAATTGQDAVIHLASPSSWNEIDSPLLHEVVVEGTGKLLQAAGQAGARVVFVSTAAAVNGSQEPSIFNEASDFTLKEPALVYAHAKRAAERLCATCGVPTVIVNPAEVYGPLDTGLITAGTLIDFAQAVPVLVCAGGTSIVHVADVAAGIVAALERGRPGERYILGGDNLTVRELARLTLSLLGRRVPIIGLPNPLLQGLARLSLQTGLPLPVNPRVVPYATLYWFMDNRKAREELGVSFRPAAEVLGPTLAWLCESGRI